MATTLEQRASIIESPADWFAVDMEDRREWVINLTSEQIASLQTATRAATAAGITLATVSKDNFRIEGFSELFADVLRRLEDGRGLAVIRGLPALDYTKDELRLMYWGIGKHVGMAVSQSSKGDLLGDVRDFGADTHSSTGRGYMSRQHLGFHTDTSDVVALMVLRPAKAGGLSKICSSLAIRNEIARTRPDLLEVLYQPFFWSWKGQEAPGERPYYEQPIYTEKNGRFSSRYIKTHIFAAHEDNSELPPLTPIQLEAMSAIDHRAIDPRFHFSMMFEPGDIQFLNNHVTMHSRTEFEDYEEEDRKRHLLRMWLSVENSRSLHPGMAPIYQDQSAGAVRGGFPSRTGSYSFETVPAQD